MKGLGLIGKKLGMTAIFTEDGRRVPVTIVKAGPCVVIQVKKVETDGYNAIQLGFEEIPERKLNKPMRGHQAKAGKGFYRILKEFRIDNVDDYKPGDEIDLSIFSLGERIKVTGFSKGRGFAGVMKRWGFAGSPASHGHEKVHRKPGSIGQCADPSRVFKGKKMPGRMGNDQVTVKNVEIVDIWEEDNILLLKGQVPGHRNGTIFLRKQQ